MNKDVRKTSRKILNAQETGRVNNKCTGKGKLVNYVRESCRVVKYVRERGRVVK